MYIYSMQIQHHNKQNLLIIAKKNQDSQIVSRFFHKENRTNCKDLAL